MPNTLGEGSKAWHRTRTRKEDKTDRCWNHHYLWLRLVLLSIAACITVYHAERRLSLNRPTGGTIQSALDRSKSRPSQRYPPSQVLYLPEKNQVARIPPLQKPLRPNPRWVDYSFRQKAPEQDDGCHFVNPQHNRTFPSCSLTHELDMRQMTFIDCGGTRCAFHLQDNDPSSSIRVVIKTIR